MITIIVGYLLISLTSGLPVTKFESEDQCVDASYHYAFVTGQEFRCVPQRQLVK